MDSVGVTSAPIPAWVLLPVLLLVRWGLWNVARLLFLRLRG
jgi:hypothetical protein